MPDLIATSGAPGPTDNPTALQAKTPAPSWLPTAGLVGIVLIAGWASLALIAPFATPLFLGCALAAVCYGAYERLERALPARFGRHATAGLCTAGLGIALMAPVALLAGLVAKDLNSGIAWACEQLGIDSVSDLSQAQMPAALHERLQPVMEYLPLSEERLQQAGAHVGKAVQPVLKALLSGSVGVPMVLGLVLITFFFALSDGHRVIALLRDVLPLRREHTETFLMDAKAVTRAAILGNLVTAAVQCVGLWVGFALAGVPHPALFALFAVPAAFIPVAGSALVYVPVVAGMAVTSHYVAAAALFAGCAALSSANTHLIKPLVVGGGIRMHIGLVFLAIFGGIKVFGMVGLIAGPLVMSIFVTALRIVRQELVEPTIRPATATVPRRRTQSLGN